MFMAAMQTINPAYVFPAPAPGTSGADGHAARRAPVRGGRGADVGHDGRASDRRAERPVGRGTAARLSAGSSTFWSATRSCRSWSSPPSIGFVVSVFMYFGANNNGVEFFVETEPEQAIVYVRARGNLSVEEMDALVRQAEEIVLTQEGVRDVFAFAGDGGLNNNTGGVSAPATRSARSRSTWNPGASGPTATSSSTSSQARLFRRPARHPDRDPRGRAGPRRRQAGEPAPVLDNWDDLLAATATARAHFDQLPGLTLMEDTLPLPGIDWQIDVDVEAAGRYGADVATVGAMVQLVTRGILLDTMRVPSSDDEIEIRVRFPEEARVLSTLDTLRTRTREGLVPLSNFVTYTPAPQLAEINRVDQSRVFEVKADVVSSLFRVDDGRRRDHAASCATRG
jgi:multidrug efflux pump